MPLDKLRRIVQRFTFPATPCVGGQLPLHGGREYIGGQMTRKHTFLRLILAGGMLAAGCSSSDWGVAYTGGRGAPAVNGNLKDDDAGTGTATTTSPGQVHVFFIDTTAGDLRHAWLNKPTGLWVAETLDGNSTTGGRTTNTIAPGSVTAYTYLDSPHVAYKDATTGALRQAWMDNGAWRFEVLDGPGASCPRKPAEVGFFCPDTTHNVGDEVSGFYWDTGDKTAHLFYRDNTVGTLKHAWFSLGGTCYAGAGCADPYLFTWRIETLDTGLAPVSQSTKIGVAETPGQIHAFYIKSGSSNSLGHTWTNWGTYGGAGWGVEYLDGPLGRALYAAPNSINGEPGAVGTSTDITVFYHDANRDILKAARYKFGVNQWVVAELDGYGTSGGFGRIDLPVGRFATALNVNDRAAVAYLGAENSLRIGILGKDDVWTSTTIDGPLDKCAIVLPVLCKDMEGRTGANIATFMDSVADGNQIYLSMASGGNYKTNTPAPGVRVLQFKVPSAGGDLLGALGPILGAIGLG